MLERLGLTATDLAERLELPSPRVEERLAEPARAPIVMLDGEDAMAPGEAAATRGLAVAADTFAGADWGSGRLGAFASTGHPGLNLDTTVHDLYTLLWDLRGRCGDDPAAFPLDGIVFPKIEHPEEVDFVNGLLHRAETALGLPNGRIRVAYLVESGWAASQLAEIVRRAAAPRVAHLRARRLQRRSRAADNRQRPSAGQLGTFRDRGGRGRGGRAGRRRDDARVPGGRPRA